MTDRRLPTTGSINKCGSDSKVPSNYIDGAVSGHQASATTATSQIDHTKIPILFFSRGRGHGHAIPDMAIADQLSRISADVDIRFASYGTGAATFVAQHRNVIDLELPESNPLWLTVNRIGQVVSRVRPVLVISHEEFAVLPVTKVFCIPTVFITEWFPDAGTSAMEALLYADDIIFIENQGIFDEPAHLRNRIHCVGPVLRAFSYKAADRERARVELNIERDVTMILVSPGGWATEQREPFADIVISAFSALPLDRKMLVWIAGSDYEMLARRLVGREDIVLKAQDWQIDRLMVASDLAITKANRITIKELASLGIPSISISHHLNPFDDIIIERIGSNTPLDARNISTDILKDHILAVLQQGSNSTDKANSLLAENQGALLAAKRIMQIIDKVKMKKDSMFTLCL